MNLTKKLIVLTGMLLGSMLASINAQAEGGYNLQVQIYHYYCEVKIGDKVISGTGSDKVQFNAMYAACMPLLEQCMAATGIDCPVHKMEFYVSGDNSGSYTMWCDAIVGMRIFRRSATASTEREAGQKACMEAEFDCRFAARGRKCHVSKPYRK